MSCSLFSNINLFFLPQTTEETKNGKDKTEEEEKVESTEENTNENASSETGTVSNNSDITQITLQYCLRHLF